MSEGPPEAHREAVITRYPDCRIEGCRYEEDGCGLKWIMPDVRDSIASYLADAPIVRDCLAHNLAEDCIQKGVLDGVVRRAGEPSTGAQKGP